jgi:TRAP-type C4-dicarboxylate transport system permease small subunit
MHAEEGDSTNRSLLEKMMQRALTLSDAIIGCLILVAIALNFGNVVSRYVFASAISWAEEALIFLSVWAVFLGAASSSWQNSHLRMDLLLATLPRRWGRALDALAAVAAILVGALVVYASWQVVSMMARFGQRSTSTDIPMVVPHSAITVGFILMLIATAARVWVDWVSAKKAAAKNRGAELP